MNNNPFTARKNARKFALQALYEWHIARSSITDVILHYLHPQSLGIVLPHFDKAYFEELVRSVAELTPELDALFSPYLQRPLETVTPIERVVLWIATWELQHRQEIPYRVILNEAIGLSKLYGATDAHGFVNGVLDPLAVSLRPAENTACDPSTRL